ncbi:Zinc finger protein 36, C3H1 type-like 1 [Thelohanellus kitauei]|uniref:Zinc finger protein 36, C3H1 type-like 1 n=1 Tax=Thelohanellus kitauei TaxID=669202 RepID=A0A0C2JC59_THEKT|nr:Zinc finger protein 36, C3H1 type-like 1 [Thelohanellus kitauei]
MTSRSLCQSEIRNFQLAELLQRNLINKKLAKDSSPTDSNYCSCSRYGSITSDVFDVEKLGLHNDVFLSTAEYSTPVAENFRRKPFFSNFSNGGNGYQFISKSNKKPDKYKTEMCRNYEWKGVCNYQDKCQYAHGSEELMPIEKHPKYKTKLCAYYHTKGVCDYGRRCNFIHDEKIKNLVSNQFVLDSTTPCNGPIRPSIKSCEPPELEFPDLKDMISNLNKML